MFFISLEGMIEIELEFGFSHCWIFSMNISLKNHHNRTSMFFVLLFQLHLKQKNNKENSYAEKIVVSFMLGMVEIDSSLVILTGFAFLSVYHLDLHVC